MQIKTKSGQMIELPSDAESAEIDAGIAADADSTELDDSFFAKAKPAAEFFDAKAYAGLLSLKRPPGRPAGSVKACPKQPTTIRFDADVLAALKATGRGWQTRVNDAMRDWVKARGAG